MSAKLSVVIPTFNEIKNNYIQQSFPLLSKIADAEVIIVDSQSNDGTRELAKKYSFKILDCPTNSRALRLKIGIESSTGEIILLHHPRSLLSMQGLNYLKTIQSGWGAFKHSFDQTHFLLKFTSFWSNHVRGARGVYYLDHCIFLHKSLKNTALKLTDMDIFEDTELCKLLRQASKPSLLPFTCQTSAIRFLKNGVLRQAWLNQRLKIKYYLGTDHTQMNRDYEKNLKLNSDYEP